MRSPSGPAGRPSSTSSARTRAAIRSAGADADRAAVIASSRALRARLAAGWEDEAAALTAAVAEGAGASPGDVVPGVVAHALARTHRAVLGLALSGEDPRHVRRAADRAYDQLAAGLEAYGR